MPLLPSETPAAAASHAACFEAQRARLLGLAWRMLGSRHEAQDLVQDLWLAWREVDLGALDQPGAYLARMATHLCIDRLRGAQRRREHYVGVWLPEPWIEAAAQADGQAPQPPPERLAFAQSVSIAFLFVLERLSPLERAAFLLHDVFDEPFDEIARHLGRSAAACRQLASRARSRVRAQGAWSDAEQGSALADVAGRSAQLLEAFAQAVGSGDTARLVALLSEDVQLLSDGGGVVTAIPRPLRGADDVARVLCALAHAWGQGEGLRERLQAARINGMPGIIARAADGRVTLAVAVQPGADGRVRGVYFMRNPHKLREAVETTRLMG